MWSLFLGAVAGALHVLSGPDHLAAVAPFATEARGARAGALWGLGHGVGVLALGLVAIALRGVLPVEELSTAGEHSVGALLIALGLWTLVWSRRPQRAHTHRAVFGMGMVHGVAGVSHLIGVLPTVALSRAAGLAYLAAFLLSAALTMAMAARGFSALSARRPEAWRAVTGVAAMAVGLFWIASV